MLLTLLAGISFAITPLVSLNLYFLSASICGFSNGVFYCVVYVWLIEIWEERCFVPLQILELMFEIGALLTPIMHKAFLGGEDQVYTNQRLSSLTWLFLLMGSIQVLAGIFQLMMIIIYGKYEYEPSQVIIERNDSAENFNGKISTKLFDNPNSSYKLFLIVFVFSFVPLYIIYMAHLEFAQKFSQFIPLKLTGSDATHIHSYFLIALAIGRTVFIMIALRMKPKTMQIVSFILIGTSLIVFLGSSNSRELLMLGNILLGFGVSSNWAAFFAFVQSYVTINDIILSILVFSCGVFKVRNQEK